MLAPDEVILQNSKPAYDLQIILVKFQKFLHAFRLVLIKVAQELFGGLIF